MSWRGESIELLRILISDMDEPPTYSDERLTRVLIIAAYQMVQQLDFLQNFTVNISEQTISPDPTDTLAGTNDEFFVNLICLKAACIIDTGSAGKAASTAVAGKDMVSSWDLRGVAASTLALLEKGWCAVLEEEIDIYLNAKILGFSVMGPIRTSFRYGYYPYNRRL